MFCITCFSLRHFLCALFSAAVYNKQATVGKSIQSIQSIQYGALWSVLCCVVLCCFVQDSAGLRVAVLCCSIQESAVALYCAVLYRTVLCYAARTVLC